jgi:co-chaperonin GroES (HSP10)
MELHNDYLFITPKPNHVTTSGIELLGNIKSRGIVREVGRGITGEEMCVKVGDEVLYNEVNGTEYTDNGVRGRFSHQRECEMIVNTKEPLNNNVLIRIEKDMSKLKSGLYIDTTYNDHAHACRYGVVVSLPRHLIYGDNGNRNYMNWITKIELRIGDNVIIDSNAWFNANKYGYYIDEGDDRFICIRYQDIYVAIRDGKILPMNGYALVEPEIDVPETNLVIPDSVKTFSKKYGIVRHLGSINTKYCIGKTEIGGDNNEIQVGDRILFQKNCNIYIEDELHMRLDKMYYRMQRRHILGALREY